MRFRPRSRNSSVEIDQRHRRADIGEVHRDAAAHRAGADDGDGFDGPYRRVGADIGNLRRLALGEKDMAQRLRLRAGHELGRDLALLLDAVGEGQGRRRFERVDDLYRRDLAARPGGDGLALLGEKGGVGAAELVGALADLPALCAAGNGDGLGELDRALEQVALHDLVDQADLLRLRGGDRIARGDHVERRLDADDARHALRAPGAREDTELHFGQSQLRGRNRDAIVAAERDFEPAAQRRAVDRDHDRLRRILEAVDDGLQAGAGHRLAELADIGAGDIGPPRADQHHGLDLGIGGRLGQAIGQALAHRRAQRVDRGVVDGDDGDVAAALVTDGVGHDSSCPCSIVLSNGCPTYRTAAPWQVGKTTRQPTGFRWTRRRPKTFGRSG